MNVANIIKICKFVKICYRVRLRFKDKSNMPERYPTVVRQDPTMEDPGFVEVDGYRLRPNVNPVTHSM